MKFSLILLFTLLLNTGFGFFDFLKQNRKRKISVNTEKPDELVGHWALFQFMEKDKDKEIRSGKKLFRITKYNKKTKKVSIDIITIYSQKIPQTKETVQVFYLHLATKKTGKEKLNNCKGRHRRKVKVSVKNKGILHGCRQRSKENKKYYTTHAVVPIWGFTDEESYNKVYNLIDFGWK